MKKIISMPDFLQSWSFGSVIEHLHISPQTREALTKLGRSKLVKKLWPSLDRAVQEEIVEACAEENTEHLIVDEHGLGGSEL
jgi:hypothetical protein